MDLAFAMRFLDVLGQEVAGELLGDDAGHQVAHDREDVGVLVGVLGGRFDVGLVHEPHQLGVQFGATGADDVAVMAILDIDPRHFRAVLHQRVLDHLLDGRDVDQFKLAGAAFFFNLAGDAQREPPGGRVIGRARRALAGCGDLRDVVFDDGAIALGHFQHLVLLCHLGCGSSSDTCLPVRG